MTPKEKAKELIEKFVPHTRVFHEVLGWEDYIDSAKQCALIAIDIVMNEAVENGVDYFYSDQGYYIDNKTLKVLGYNQYWQKVKQEIEKL